MTGPDMNAWQVKKIVGSFAALSPVLALAGCAGAFDPSMDTTSPVAPRVQALVDANRTYPHWADFPPAPAGLPSPVEVATRVNTLRATGGAMAGEVARIDWQEGDPLAFAAEVNSRIDAKAISPVTAETQAEVEAFVRQARDRGRAPPPVDRPPTPR